jgi:hypothetical protein
MFNARATGLTALLFFMAMPAFADPPRDIDALVSRSMQLSGVPGTRPHLLLELAFPGNAVCRRPPSTTWLRCSRIPDQVNLKATLAISNIALTLTPNVSLPGWQNG